MITERIAPFVRLIRQLDITNLTNVAVNVKIFFHGNNSHSFFSSLNWSNALSASRTFRSKNSVKIINAVDFVVKVHSEGHSVEAVVAHTASKATRMISLAHGLQNHFHDEVAADAALFGRLLKAGVQIILLAVHLAVDVIKGLPS